MKKTKLLTSVLAVLLATSMVLAGCGGGGTSSQTKSSAYVGTPNANEVTINITSEPPKMNSVLATDATSHNLLRHTNEGLTILDKENNATPGMAEKWDVSDDKLTYTFHLRDGIKWSDGSDVLAKDFVFAWKTLLNPDVGAEYSYMAYVFKGAQEYNTGKATADDVAISAPDDKTLTFTLHAPVPYILSLLSFAAFLPIKESVYSDQYATEASNILCNGPYLMTTWDHESKVVLEKNPEYWNAETIKLEKVNMLMINDSSTALNSFQSNEIDMINVTGDQSAQLQTEGETVEAYADGSSWALAFNLGDKVTGNKDMRMALTKAIDRASFIKNVLKNDSAPSAGWTPGYLNAGGKAFESSLPEAAFKDNDIEGAKADFAKAKEAIGEDFTLSVLCDDTDNAKLQAAYYQECWKKVGIDVTVTSVPFKDRLARQAAHDYQISIYGWSPDYNDPQTFLDLWESTSGNNIIGLKDDAYDANVAIARTEPDEAKRTAALVAMEKALRDEFYLGPIYQRQTSFIRSAKLDGVVRTPFQDLNLRWAYTK